MILYIKAPAESRPLRQYNGQYIQVPTSSRSVVQQNDLDNQVYPPPGDYSNLGHGNLGHGNIGRDNLGHGYYLDIAFGLLIVQDCQMVYIFNLLMVDLI